MFRALLFVCVFSLLSGCAVIKAYNTAKYDPNEYDKINNIRTNAQLGTADCENVFKIKHLSYVLYNSSIELKNYSSSLPENEEASKLGELLVEVTSNLKKSYDDDKPKSKAFCELKLKNVEDSAKRIQTVVARKPR